MHLGPGTDRLRCWRPGCNRSGPALLFLEVVVKLFEFSPTRSIRVRWTLQELGVDFEAVTVNLMAGEHRRPEFLKLNPAGSAIVNAAGPIRQIVQSSARAERRYLVIAAGEPAKPGTVVQVQTP